jgi:DNA-binding beta-propeller fold protein YncE
MTTGRRRLISAILLALVSAAGIPAAAQLATSPHGDPVAPSGAVTGLNRSLPLREIADRSGKWLAVIHGGFDTHGIAIVDASTGAIVSRVAIHDAYEAVDFSVDDRTLLVGQGQRLLLLDFDPATGHVGSGRSIEVDGLYQTVVRALPGGDVLVVTRSFAATTADSAGTIRGVSGPSGGNAPAERHEAFVLERITLPGLDAPGQRVSVRWKLPLPGLPSSLVITPDGKRAFVTAWLADRVTIVDLDRAASVADIPTPAHPIAIAYAPQHDLLYVACAGTNSIAVVDARTARPAGTIDVGALRGGQLGATPNALTLTRDERTLYVANADENNIIRVQLDGRGGAPAGAIQVGAYPTDVLLSADDQSLYVLDGRGRGALPNPEYRPYYPGNDPGWLNVWRNNPNFSPGNDYFGVTRSYVGNMEQGLLERIDLRKVDDVAGLATLTGRMNRRAAEVPHLPPVKHVIYVIKENRSYDQIFGDDPRGNGDPRLAMFGRRVTPNVHALVDQFVLADNYRLDGEVSENGWPFAISAYAMDTIQRAWPANYAGQPLPAGYDASVTAEQSLGGYIWDRALQAGLSVRLYSLFVEYLTPSIYLYVAPFVDSPDDNLVDDDVRFQQWLDEFHLYEKNGNLPSLEVMALSGDHTDGTAPYHLTPNAAVAKNDYYVGRMVDALSHSKYWKDTVILFSEDDAQNGPDHVSSQRSYFVAAGGYVRRNAVVHTAYSQTGLLRTIEVLLGMKPMTEWDATATVMSGLFSTTPNMTPYSVINPHVSITETNPPHAVDATISAGMRFDRPDQNDPALLNRVLWDYALAAGNLPRSSRWAWTPPASKWVHADDGTSGDGEDSADEDAARFHASPRD